jgi:hypothetical protein
MWATDAADWQRYPGDFPADHSVHGHGVVLHHVRAWWARIPQEDGFPVMT